MSRFKNPFYASIRNSCKYYLRRKFRHNYEYLSEYEGQISILASFLFISSSFMFKVASDQYFDFKWQSSFRVYKFGALNVSIVCAIRYWLDIHPDLPNRDKIENSIPGLKKDFRIQYRESIEEHHKKYGGEVVDVEKQLILLDLVLKVYHLYKNEISKDASKVLDLVKYLMQWKEIALDVFKYKAEYVLFSFLVNLSR